MIRILWAKIVLWWHNYCPKHKCQKLSWADNHDPETGHGRAYWGKKCVQCFKDKKKNKKTSIEKAIETLRPKEEQWQTIKQNKK